MVEETDEGVLDEKLHCRDKLLDLDYLQEVQEDPADRWIHGDPSVPSLQSHQPLPCLHEVLVVPGVQV